MKQIHYRVAGHAFLIETEDAGHIVSLLPSYDAFRDEREDRKPVFSLTVDTKSLKAPAEEIYHFVQDKVGYTVFRGEAGYGIRIHPEKTSGSYLMCTDAEFTQATVSLQGDLPNDRFVLNNCLMMMYAFSTVLMDTLLVHASVIARRGKGYLFLGKSGTGKSTHSRLWLEHIPGSELLNDDNPVVRVIGGRVIVSGSPWSGKTPCYINREWPVGAIVKLRQAPENKISGSGPARSFAMLLASCSTMIWDRRVFGGISDTVIRIAEKIPGYQLDCLPDEAAARLCSETVADE